MTKNDKLSPLAQPAGSDSDEPQLDRGPLDIQLWRLLLYVVLAVAVLFLLEQAGIFGV